MANAAFDDLIPEAVVLDREGLIIRVSDIQIAIDTDGRISGVGPQTAAPTHQLDLALAAPVNLHSHAFQRAMAGLTETRGPDPRDSFWTWRRLMYRFLDRLTPDHVQAIAALVFMEMLETHNVHAMPTTLTFAHAQNSSACAFHSRVKLLTIRLRDTLQSLTKQ